MNLKVLFATLLLVFTGLGSFMNKPQKVQDVFAEEYEKVEAYNNSYFKVGDINLHPYEKMDYLSSPFTVKLYKTHWLPEINIDISYIDKNRTEIYLYRHYYITNEINANIGGYYGDFRIPLNRLSELTTIRCQVHLSYPRITTDFSFKISNPTKLTYLYNDTSKVYTMFYKNLNEDFGRNYYKAFKIDKPKNAPISMYYYSHYNFNKYLKLKANDPYCMQSTNLFIYDPYTTLFYNSTYTKAGWDKNYRFFTLLATYDLSNRAYSFVFGKEYFVDPVTNIMFQDKAEGRIPILNSIYMPLKHYQTFKSVRLGLIMEYKANRIVYKLRHDFYVKFQEHYYKDEVIVYKEIKKTTKDSTLEEKIL